MSKVSIIFCLLFCIILLSCSNKVVSTEKETTRINEEKTSNDTPNNNDNTANSKNLLISMLKHKLNFDYANSYKDLKKFDKENVFKIIPSQFQYERDNFEKYDGDRWLTGKEKIRFFTDTKNFESERLNIVATGTRGLTATSKKTGKQFSFSFTTFSYPRFAALRVLVSDKTVGHSTSLNEVASAKIGNFGFVWLSDIKRSYEYDTKKYDSQEEAYKAMLKDDQLRLNSEEAKKVLKEGEEYYFDMMTFFRDNVLIKVSAPKKHIPLGEEYNVYDFAKEIDEFIQKQPTVDEFKPATLEFVFENYNVDTYKWMSGKDYLQAAFVDVENDIDVYEELYENALKEFGVLEERGIYHKDLYKKHEKELLQIHRSLEYPMRMKVSIADQLGNKGGVAEIAGIFKGQSDAEIPESLTLENLEKIYDTEIENGIDEDKISWYDDDWAEVDYLDKENKNTKYFLLTEGRYIIVIDVTTSTNVKSRHFYELKVEHPEKNNSKNN